MTEANMFQRWADAAREHANRTGHQSSLAGYILKDKTTGEVEKTDLPGHFAWRGQCEESGEDPCRIDLTNVDLPGGKVGSVSTVFLGLDARESDPPRIFETLVQGDSIYCGKYSRAASIAEAREHHARWVRVLQAEAQGQASEEYQADMGIEEMVGLLGLLLHASKSEDGGKQLREVLHDLANEDGGESKR
jgi:hypothetical protein